MQAANAWALQLYNKGTEHGLPMGQNFGLNLCYESLHNKWKNTLKIDREAAGKTMKGEYLP